MHIYLHHVIVICDIHKYIQIYIHTYIHKYIHTYINTYIHTYIHTHIHTYIHTYEIFEILDLNCVNDIDFLTSCGTSCHN